jgi:aminobenzoyl-glutamate transport protein
MSTPAVAETPVEQTFMTRMLDAIERGGNKMPSPAVLFLYLCLGVIALSQVLYWADVKVTYQVAVPAAVSVDERYDGGTSSPSASVPGEPPAADGYHIVTKTAAVQGLLTADGVRYIFTSFVANFRNFAAVAIMLVVMIGVGVAEASGLIGALIRRLVAASSEGLLSPIIIFAGVLSSVASDAGYLVLIPLGAVAFRSVGRNPLAGIAAAFAGVSAGFGVNFLIAPFDAVVTEITNDAIGLVDPNRSIDLASNIYFGIGSAILVTLVAAIVTSRVVEPQLGKWDPADASPEGADEPTVEVDAAAESRGLRLAVIATVGVVVAIGLLTVLPNAPLRNETTGKIIGDSPFMNSLIVIITLIFFAAGLGYGRGAGTLRGSDAIIGAITKSWAGLSGLIFLFLLIAQFIAYFDYSNMAQVAAVKLGDILEEANIGAIWLLVGLILVTTVVNMIMPAIIAKWAILAPIFIPLFLRLGVEPQTVLAAYRVGDSPTNVITPLMAYFPLIVVFVQRYKKEAGIGTVVSMMLPYTAALAVAWTIFFVIWYALGIPLGPGAPVR